MGEPNNDVILGPNGTAGVGVYDERIAITPTAAEDVPDLLSKVATLGNEYSTDVRSRMKLLEAARSLVYALETPREAMIRYCWAQVSLHSDSIFTASFRAATDPCFPVFSRASLGRSRRESTWVSSMSSPRMTSRKRSLSLLNPQNRIQCCSVSRTF